MKCHDITEAIGNTPLVKLRRLPDECCADVYLKLEGLNPSGSVKARTALELVFEAERTGSLRQGGAMIESSSENLGVALSMIAAARGYGAIIVTDEKVNTANLAMMRAYGAEVLIVEGQGAEGACRQRRLDVARRIAEETPGAVLCHQHANPVNFEAHYATTAQELLADLEQIDCLVVAVRNGGQISGIARCVRELKPDTQIVAVDCLDPTIFGGKLDLQINGLSWRLANLDLELIDEVYKVKDEDACIAARVLACTEGIMCSGSAGMAILVALKKARELGANKSVVVVIPDRGEKYYDQIFDDSWMTEHGFMTEVSMDMLYQRAEKLVPLQAEGAGDDL